MADLNKTILSGRIVRNRTSKTTPNGLFIANFPIAVNNPKKNDDGSWTTVGNFFYLNLYGKRAQGLEKYLVKGQQVNIEGHLFQRRWEKNGVKNSRIEIAVDDIQLIGNLVKAATAENDPSQSKAFAQKDSTQPLDATTFENEIPLQQEFSEPEFDDSEDIF